ncbi:MAG: hypothetical protein HY721_04070 [Planctomycetes bacterium]|nr:hypothetical protein [Planctomycetota bacterium]
MRRDTGRSTGSGGAGLRGGRRAARASVLACVGAAAVLAAGLSCGPLRRESGPETPRARLLKEAELSVLMTRLGTYPRRLVTALEKVPVRCYFDPELVDLRRVKGTSIWALEEGSTTWRKVGTASPEAQPLELEPAEGVLGLRASATYSDGTERLVPRPGDEPALWLCADRSPPEIELLPPRLGSTVLGARALQIEWTLAELQLGDAPVVIEWSPDGGGEWRPIARLAPAAGPQRYLWPAPPEAAQDILVRVTARDMAGHEASRLAAFNPSGGALLAEVSSRVTAAPAAAAEEAPPTAPAPASAPAPGPGPAVATAETETETEAKAETEVAGAPAEGAGPPVPALAPAAAPERPRAVLEPLPARFVRGGSRLPVAWRLEGAPSSAPATLEWSGDGGATWSPAGTAALDAGKVEWEAPLETRASCLLRLRAVLEDGTPVEARSTEPFAVDADPPRAELAGLPPAAGDRLSCRLDLTDPGGSGVARTAVRLRRAGGPWEALGPEDARIEGGRLEVALGDRPEGAWEIHAGAEDAAGNAAPAPTNAEPGAVGPDPPVPGIASFRIDRTPPALAARASPLAWVAGFPAEAQVEADWTDAVPPLVIEGQEPDGSWRDAGRWASVSPEEGRFGFLVPAGAARHAVRFTVADAAGNRAQAVVGPREVEPPLRLETFAETKAYPSRATEKIVWRLHPVAAEVEDELRVSIDHQARQGGEWALLYADLPARADCYWDLPRGEDGEHRIRVRLVRKGKVVAEEVSPPFTILGAGEVEPTVVRLNQDSVFYSDQAKAQAEKYFAALAGSSGASSVELDRLRQVAVASFTKALEVDADNYHATYGLAQLLNRTAGDEKVTDVARWLERTVEIKPDHFWALNDLGAVHIRDGDFAGAEEVLRRCVAIDPAAIVLYNLGLALFYGGKAAEARDRLEAALGAAGGSELPQGDVYYFLVQTYLKEGDMDRARELFRAKAGLFPEELKEELQRSLQG